MLTKISPTSEGPLIPKFSKKIQKNNSNLKEVSDATFHTLKSSGSCNALNSYTFSNQSVPQSKEIKKLKTQPSSCRELLTNSMQLISELNETPDDAKSYEVSQVLKQNIELYCSSNCLPFAIHELKQHYMYHEQQRKTLKTEVKNKELEILELKNQLDQTPKLQLTQNYFRHLVTRIETLENENKILKDNYLKTTDIKRKLNKLPSLDAGDKAGSIEQSYHLILQKLTAFVIGIMGLNSGLVERESGWKDELVSQVFIFLNIISDSAGVATSFAFGAGAVIPLIIAPILAQAELAYNIYRHIHKANEFKHAAHYIPAGLEKIEEKNQKLAYELAYLLQMQLRYCTPKGVEAIVDNLLYDLFYSLMKKQHREEAEISKVTVALSHIFGRDKKHAIETHADRNWTTSGLLKKAGVVYYRFGEICYESFYKRHKKTAKKSCISNAKKYGYLFFSDMDSAKEYKNFMKEYLSKKNKRDKYEFIWSKDAESLGPQVFEKDKPQISSPTIIPRFELKDSPFAAISNNPLLAVVSPEVEKLNEKVKELMQKNLELQNNLNAQTVRFSNRLSNIEEQLKSLN